MFHSVDTETPTDEQQRATWMALLARAPIELLEATVGEKALPAPNWLRAPETGLMMVQGRVGGTGERFNVGEVSVTRCALRWGDQASERATVGVAYVIGRSHRRVTLAALADALLQDESQRELLEASLLTPTRDYLARCKGERHSRAQSTKVEFFTIARESSANNNEGSSEE